MSDNECTNVEDQVVWSKILTFLSKYIVPIVLIPICSGVFFGSIWVHGAVKGNTKDVGYVKKEIERVSTEHHSRIMENSIGIEKTGERVSKIEVYLPQILDYMKDNKSENKDNRKHQREIIKSISSLEKTVAILIDRDQRIKPKQETN